MEKKVLSSGQVICMLGMFLLASGLITGGAFNAKQDSWISMILAILLCIPVVLMYSCLSKLCPGQNLYDLFYCYFGRIAGTLLSSLYVVYSIYLGTRVIRISTEFIQVTSFPETPQWFVGIFIAAICVWIMLHGIFLLGRVCAVILPLVLIVISVVILLSIKDMDLNYIRPIFEQDIALIWRGAIVALCYPLAETVLFISILPMLHSKVNPSKVYMWGLILGGGFLLLVILRNTLMIGIPLIEMLFFPSYADISIVNIGHSFGRIEAVVSANMTVCLVVKTCVCIYAAAEGIKRMYRPASGKWICIPLAAFMVIASTFLFLETSQIFQFIDSYILYAPILQIAIPALLLLTAFAKRKARNA